MTLALSEQLIIAQNKLQTQWPWLLAAELKVNDDADTYHRWVQDHKDLVAMLDTYDGSGCVGHWKLNDNIWSTQVLDASGNGNHGAAQRNTVDLHTNGLGGGAFRLNGSSDYFSVADNSDLDNTSPLAISVWVNPDIDSVYTNVVLQKGDGDVEYNYYIRLTAGNEVEFTRSGAAGTSVLTGGANITAGNLYHIAVVDAGGTATVYVNGVALGSAASGGGQANNYPLYIGWDAYGAGSNYFAGMIDDVRIFNRALSPAEISMLYNSGKGTELVPATFSGFNFELSQVTYKGGEVPTSTIRITNVSQFIKADLAANDGCTESEFTLRIIHEGLLYQDYSELDVSFDVVYPKITSGFVEFVLGGPSPFRRRVPPDRFFADACRYVGGFKTDPRCGYTGGETACSGLRSRCRELGNEAKFGGFPGLRSETMRLA